MGDAVTRKECGEVGPVKVAVRVGVAEASSVLREESGVTSRFQIWILAGWQVYFLGWEIWEEWVCSWRGGSQLCRVWALCETSRCSVDSWLECHGAQRKVWSRDKTLGLVALWTMPVEVRQVTSVSELGWLRWTKGPSVIYLEGVVVMWEWWPGVAGPPTENIKGSPHNKWSIIWATREAHKGTTRF